jgi:hypothetical protein
MSDIFMKIDLNNLPDRDPVDRRSEVQELFKNIKEGLPELESMLQEYSVNFTPGMAAVGHWTYEDPLYRFYHHSFKVLRLQEDTIKIVETLKSLLPGRELNRMFMRIIEEGTAISSVKMPFDVIEIAGGQVRELKSDDEGMPIEEINMNWEKYTRPILEAFFHAKFMLEMAVKYGKTLEYPSNCLPSGWAALLYLYNLR